MKKYNRDKQKRHQNTAVETFYLQPDETKLSENYAVHNGFLYKGDTPISLVTSGIIEMAAEGFLHVDEIEKYEP